MTDNELKDLQDILLNEDERKVSLLNRDLYDEIYERIFYRFKTQLGENIFKTA